MQKFDLTISGIDHLSQVPRWHNVTEINATGNGVSIAALGWTVQHHQTRTKSLWQAAGQPWTGW